MRVSYILMTFPAETFATNDIRAVVRAGHEVEVFTLRGPRDNTQDLLEHANLGGLPVDASSLASVLAGVVLLLIRPHWSLPLALRLAIDNWKAPVQLGKAILSMPRVLDIFRKIRTRNPDVVHLFWGHYPAALGLLIKCHSPASIVTMFLGAYDLTNCFRTSQTCATMADTVFTHARANVSALRKRGIDEHKINVVYRGIDLEYFGGATDEPAVKSPFRIISAGSLIEEKGFLQVLDVFQKVQETWSESSLSIIGDGVQRAELERTVAAKNLQNVDFLGQLEHRRVFEELSKSDVFLFLSHGEWERLSNVVKEAIMAECLCVVSNTVGIQELVEHGKHGYVVEARDTERAAEYIGEYFRHRDEHTAWKQAAKSHVVSKFDVKETMAIYINHWQKLLRQRSQTRY